MEDQALKGLRVIEYGKLISAPFCARILGDMGAEVIKVEEGEGDISRKIGPFPEDDYHPEKGGLFHYLNANKKGVLIDVESAKGRSTLLKLIREADVFIENESPLRIEKLGLNYQSLSEINPPLIMTSITPYGQTGPYRDWKGYDLNCCAVSGVSWVLGFPHREPLSLPFGQCEFQAAYNGAAATIAALLARRKTGRGALVDISIAQVMAYYCGTHSVIYRNRGIKWARIGRGMAGGVYPTGFFPCKDGFICVASQSSYQWKKIMELMGNQELINNPKFQDAFTIGKDYPEKADAYFYPWLSQYSREDLFKIALKYRLTLSPVIYIDDLLSIDQFRERKFWINLKTEDELKITIPGLSFKLSESPWKINSPAPKLGEHNEDFFHHFERRGTGQIDKHFHHDKLIKPLEGYRLIDFGWNWAGPMVGQILGDMGAEVIKVESESRKDYMRTIKFLQPFFQNINRSKLSITVNIKHPKGLGLIKSLVKKSDLVLDNFSAGVMKKLGLGYEALRAVKENIIVLSMSMAGQTGTLNEMRGFAGNATSFGGLESLVGYPENGIAGLMMFGYGDVTYAIQAIYASLAALYYREETGKGQFIDVSEIEAVASNLGEPVLDYLWNRRRAGPQGNQHRYFCPHGIYPCKGEDRWVSIVVGTEEEWEGLCKAINRLDLKEDIKFFDIRSRKRNEEELEKILIQWTKKHDPKEAVEILQREGVAGAPVYTIEERDADLHFRERNLFEEVNHPEYGKAIIYNTPWRFDRLQGEISPTPSLGQHNDYVFKDLLGLSDIEINQLKEEKVIY